MAVYNSNLWGEVVEPILLSGVSCPGFTAVENCAEGTGLIETKLGVLYQ